MTGQLKNIVIGLIAIIFIVAAVIIYRIFFQFNAVLVKQYALAEASKYSDVNSAYSLIMDSVENILASHNLTQQVLKSAAVNGSGKEQELVHAAIMQCRAYDYLNAV